MEKENEEKFGEEKSLPARGGEDRTRGKVLGWFELVAQLDNYPYFNTQRTEKYSIALMMMILTADCS